MSSKKSSFSAATGGRVSTRACLPNLPLRPAAPQVWGQPAGDSQDSFCSRAIVTKRKRPFRKHCRALRECSSLPGFSLLLPDVDVRMSDVLVAVRVLADVSVFPARRPSQFPQPRRLPPALLRQELTSPPGLADSPAPVTAWARLPASPGAGAPPALRPGVPLAPSGSGTGVSAHSLPGEPLLTAWPPPRARGCLSLSALDR